MAEKDNIRSKNIKFNLKDNNDRIILDYFSSHNENFSKVTKKLLIEYIGNASINTGASLTEILTEQTKLLRKIADNCIVSVDKSEDKKIEKEEINMDFYKQL